MPYTWNSPPTVIVHNGVEVFNVFKGKTDDTGKYRFRFTTDEYEDDGSVRYAECQFSLLDLDLPSKLPSEPSEIEILTAIVHGIETNQVPLPHHLRKP